jgi:hypothetical protein
MRTRDFTAQASLTSSSINYERMARRLNEQRFGPRNRAVNIPYIVDCPILTSTHFQSCGRSERAMREGRAWCKRHGFGGFSIEPIGDATNPEGLRFRFANGSSATLFRLLHVTDPQMPSAKAGE